MIKKVAYIFLPLALVAALIVIFYANHHQNNNIRQVLAQKLDGRLIPHKANYANKLNNILSDDLHSFEFDTLFNGAAKTPYFEIGHDEQELNGTSFEEYLHIADDKQINKIWMDIKNVDANNIASILARLNDLDKKYHIKNILVFETSSRSPMLKAISDAGYHTSYYLPTDVLQAMSAQNAPAIQTEAIRIKTQIAAQNLNAVSFPSKLYPFVKSHLEKIISDDIVYHTWGTFKFKKKNELEKIQAKDFYKDARVKTIIYSYYNNKLNRLYRF